MEVQRVARSLEALGNTTRLEIYKLLVKAGDSGFPVGTLQSRTGIPRSTLSHHLHRLIDAGLVTQERQGTTLYCRTDYAVMNGIIEFLTSECCVEQDCGEGSDRTSADSSSLTASKPA
ncbi:MAG: metalloregulator ArsR/SmtB family transcription factor [Cyanobacteria bacterium P01_A01_bin.3]